MDPVLKSFLEAMQNSLQNAIKEERTESVKRHDELVRKLEEHASKTDELVQWKPDPKLRIAKLQSAVTELQLARPQAAAFHQAPAPSIVASPPSVTNGMVSTELAPNDEHGDLLDDSSIYMSARPAAHRAPVTTIHESIAVNPAGPINSIVGICSFVKLFVCMVCQIL